MSHYTTKDEREDERFQALRDEYEAEIRQLFNDGWRGQKGLRLPQVRISKYGDVICYDQPFPTVIFECLSNDACMALLLDIMDPQCSSPGTFIDGLKASCVAQYLKDNLDDIVRCAWEARDEG
jgi:hypothetical protein